MLFQNQSQEMSYKEQNDEQPGEAKAQINFNKFIKKNEFTICKIYNHFSGGFYYAAENSASLF